MGRYSRAMAKALKKIRFNEKKGEVTPASSIHKSTLRALIKREVVKVNHSGNVFSTEYGKWEACFEWGVSEDDREGQ